MTVSMVSDVGNSHLKLGYFCYVLVEHEILI